MPPDTTAADLYGLRFVCPPNPLLPLPAPGFPREMILGASFVRSCMLPSSTDAVACMAGVAITGVTAQAILLPSIIH